jgi:hypothetical protein
MMLHEASGFRKCQFKLNVDRIPEHQNMEPKSWPQIPDLTVRDTPFVEDVQRAIEVSTGLPASTRIVRSIRNGLRNSRVVSCTSAASPLASTIV